MDKKTTAAAIRTMLALAWKLHKTLHREGVSDQYEVNYDAFMDMCSDAISDDDEWYRRYWREVKKEGAYRKYGEDTKPIPRFPAMREYPLEQHPSSVILSDYRGMMWARNGGRFPDDDIALLREIAGELKDYCKAHSISGVFHVT